MILSFDLWDKPVFRQATLSLCTSMSFFCIGLVRGYSSPAIPSIHATHPELLPNKNIASWASSIPPSGAFCGSLIAGFLLQYIGRKNTIIISSPLATIGWILIATATRYEIIILGRFITGFCVGLCLPSAQIYIGESCDPAIRGILGSLPSIMMSVGILSAYIIGSVCTWDTLAWYCSSMAFLLSIIMFAMPESPVWLRSKNRFNEADQSTKWLKLSTNSIQLPVQDKAIAVTIIEKAPPILHEAPKLRDVIFTRPIMMPLTIGLMLLVLQQISGIDAIIFFTVEIFRESGSTINENLATIIVGGVQLVSNISALFVVDKAGRKPLLLASAIIMCLSMASIGTAFYLNKNNMNSFGFLPLASLIVYMMGFSIGFGCIPFLLLGEIFPADHRSILSSIAGSFNLGVMFIVIKTYHYLEKLITTAGTFWMYSVFCAFAAVFVVTVVPETKGRDLDSIAKLFVKNRSTSQDTPEAMTAGDTNGHCTASTNSKATTVELHVPSSDAMPIAETHKSHANLEITKM